VLIGENSSFPHGHAGNRKLKIGDALLFDFGCVYNGYHSDFTRTYFFKEVSDSFRKIYAVVKEANEIGRNLVKIGTSLHEVDDRVTKYLEDSPYSKFIGHRTGHGLGMEIHEDPSVVRGNHQKLQLLVFLRCPLHGGSGNSVAHWYLADHELYSHRRGCVCFDRIYHA
jgi:Xaa-Pro aminopeptidase